MHSIWMPAVLAIFMRFFRFCNWNRFGTPGTHANTTKYDGKYATSTVKYACT